MKTMGWEGGRKEGRNERKDYDLEKRRDGGKRSERYGER